TVARTAAETRIAPGYPTRQDIGIGGPAFFFVKIFRRPLFTAHDGGDVPGADDDGDAPVAFGGGPLDAAPHPGFAAQGERVVLHHLLAEGGDQRGQLVPNGAVARSFDVAVPPGVVEDLGDEALAATPPVGGRPPLIFTTKNLRLGQVDRPR